MKKGTIPIIILIILIILLVVIGVLAYNFLYVPDNYAMRIENTTSETANIVYIYENGKVIFNNAGINKYKTSISKEKVDELLNSIQEYEFKMNTKVYVVTTKDGKQTNVANKFLDVVAQNVGVKDIFTEGTK